MRTLRDLQVKEKATVVRLHGNGPLRRRIHGYGRDKRAFLSLSKSWPPLGDPIEVTVRGYELSIRKADAGLIE